MHTLPCAALPETLVPFFFQQNAEGVLDELFRRRKRTLFVCVKKWFTAAMAEARIDSAAVTQGR
jgi:hypothetical protein